MLYVRSVLVTPKRTLLKHRLGRVIDSFSFVKGYVNLVSLVAHFQVAVDAILVNVRYAGHIGDALVRCGTDAA